MARRVGMAIDTVLPGVAQCVQEPLKGVSVAVDVADVVVFWHWLSSRDRRRCGQPAPPKCCCKNRRVSPSSHQTNTPFIARVSRMRYADFTASSTSA